MSLDNAKEPVDIFVPQYEEQKALEYKKQPQNANEDKDPITLKNNLGEDTTPSTQYSPTKLEVQSSTVQESNNLFELLIKRIDSNAGEENTKAMSDSFDVNQQEVIRVERHHNVNGNSSAFAATESSSLNGQGNHEQNVISSSENITSDNRSAQRSIYDHLRENFSPRNGNRPPENDRMSTYTRKKPTDDAEITSSTANEVELNTVSMRNSAQVSKDAGYTVSRYDEPSSDHVILIDDDDDDGGHHTVHKSRDVFPFTQRLKMMSQRSREGSPLLPQQPAHEKPTTLPSYHGSHIITNQISPKQSMMDPNRTGFRPFFGHTISSNSGPVSLHLQNGSLGLSHSNVIPNNEVYLLLDPQTQFVKRNFIEPVQAGQNGGLVLQTEQFTQTCAPLPVPSGFSHEIRPTHSRGSVFSEADSLTSNNRRNSQYSVSPSQNREPQAICNMWERRPTVVSSADNRLPVSFSQTQSTSAFSRPAVIHQSPVAQRFDSSSFQRNTNSLSCNERLSKSPDHFSIRDRLFRPVSPTWTNSLYSNTVSLNTGETSNMRTAESDADEFSYACALHETANSPDIERMLGSESPLEKSSISSPPSLSESPPNRTIHVISSDSKTVREPNISDSLPTIKQPTVKSSVLENSSDINDDANNCSDKNFPDSSREPKKKRKINLNVIHKRLEPKLPSPVREISSGDLFQDPSKLTREERALQRAMMRFSELEMKEKVLPNMVKSKRDSKADEPKNTEENKMEVSTETKSAEKKEECATNPLKVKRKHKRWIKKHQKDFKKVPVIANLEVKVEPLSDEIKAHVTIGTDPMVKLKKKIRKRKRLKDNEEILLAKKQKFMNEAKKQFNEKVAKTTNDACIGDVEDHKTVATAEEILRREKKKAKKLKLKRRLEEKHGKSKHFDKIHSPSVSSTVTSTQQILSTPEPSAVEKKRIAEEKHRVKTYMLVPSYQGFKDFQPVVIESRTRRKKTTQANESGPENKPKIPLLVVESVHSKPVKEMIVAENEEVQKLVTECLRVHGKWHGDELEQALKREEAELKEEVTRFRDAKKLSVNRTTGETILHKSARLGYDEIVKQCILQGADPNAKDNAGWTPLHEACARGKLAVVKVLTRYGADVNSQSNDGIRPIHDAAEAGHIDVIRVLLSYGADPFLVTYAGLNALACARHPKIKAFLQEYFTDIGHPVPDLHPKEQDGWEFCGSNSTISDERPDRVSGVWDDIPDCSETFCPEFEISDRPHINTYNLPVMKDDVIVGRRNYMLIQELHDSGHVAKTTLQKKLKSADILEIPWSKFLEHLSENHLCVKPSYTPEGTSTDEPKAQLVPLNYTMRRLLGIRVESCRGFLYKVKP